MTTLHSYAEAFRRVKKERDEAKTNLKTVGCVVALLLFLPSCIYRGFVWSVLWAWFAVPLGLPAIGAVHALGLILLVSAVRPDGSAKAVDESEANPGLVLVRAILTTSFVWGAGWIVHAWM